MAGENPFAKYAPAAGPVYGAPEDPIKARADARASNADSRAARAADNADREWKAEHNPDGSKKTPAEKNPQAYSQSAMDSFNRAIDSGNRLLTARGGAAAIGSGFDPQAWGSFNPFTEAGRAGKPMAGTPAASYVAQLNAMKAQVFLPMVQSMKGMGALSNAEGDKLTAAIGALDTSMEEEEFTSSLHRILDDLKTYRDRAVETGKPAKAAPAGQPKRLRYNPATGDLE